jgi:hypothetical protein
LPGAPERRRPRRCAAAPPFLDPGRYGGRVSAGVTAELGNLPHPRLVELSFVEAFHSPGDLGEQISAAAGQLAQFGDRGRMLGFGQVTPLSVARRRALKPGDEYPVRVSPGTASHHRPAGR